MVKRAQCATLFVDRIEPPLRRTTASFPIKINFDPRSFGGFELKPMTLKIVVAAVALGGAPASHDPVYAKRSPFPVEGGRHRWFASGRGRDEGVARRRDRPAYKSSHDSSFVTSNAFSLAKRKERAPLPGLQAFQPWRRLGATRSCIKKVTKTRLP